MILRSERFWQITLGITAIAVTLITFLTTWVIPRGRQLQAVILSKTTLLDSDAGGPPANLRLIYRDREVSNISTIEIRIKNSGGQPIRSEDIDEPIRIILQKTEEIISADIVSSQPQDLPVRTSLVNNSVELTRTLLNPDDQFIVRVTAVPRPNMQSLVQNVTGRIVGVRQIDFQPSLPTTRREVGLLTSILLQIITAIMTIFIYISIYRIIKRRTRR